MRIVEILIAVNALCGIAAFVITRNLIKRTRRKIFGELELEEKKQQRVIEQK